MMYDLSRRQYDQLVTIECRDRFIDLDDDDVRDNFPVDATIDEGFNTGKDPEAVAEAIAEALGES